ncbi:hypothetical protein MRS44_014795 [Fusarium solani]|uniref:uncharacterized protein n=1 Tax=Fusarium solani TaxID=169388 RepID=UPI0032C45A4D|nr:hypothetical protein MRS44_014795 [Fusarium solani]
MNDTASEAPQVVQDSWTEYLHWPIFWVFLFFILANLVFQPCLSQPPKRPEDPIHDTSTHNHTTVDHPEGTETATSAHGESVDANSSSSAETGSCESQTLFWWKPLSPAFTSRNTQCVVVIFSSLLLLVQLIEGYWVMETFARLTSQGPVDNEAAPAKPFALLFLILSCLSFLFILLVWAFLIVAGVFWSSISMILSRRFSQPGSKSIMQGASLRQRQRKE